MAEPKDKNLEDGQENVIQDEELSQIIATIEASYWVPLLKSPFEILDRNCADSEKDCRYLSGPFKSFNTNLRAAEKILLFPYDLVSPYIWRDPKANQYLRELESSKHSENSNSNQTNSREKMIEFVKLGLNISGKVFSNRIELNYIMYQACILIWSAFETFCKDVFILSLNEKPELYFNLQQNSDLKERFSVSSGSWQKLLEEHRFNLNGKLGTIVGSNKDFSSPKLLQEVFCCLFNGGISVPPEYLNLLNYFKGNDLWVLGQRRHLIAHRCGIVDQEYIDKTKDLGQILGEPLSLKGRDIAAGMGAVAQCAISLYANARYCWERPSESESTK